MANAVPITERASDSSATRRRFQWSPYWAVTLVIVAWAASASNFVDRHWISPRAQNIRPLADDDARLEIERIVPLWKDETHEFGTNLFIVNHGKDTATNIGNIGTTVVSLVPLDNDFIDSYFLGLRTKTKSDTVTTMEYTPGESGHYFTIPNPPLHLDEPIYSAAKNGHALIYTFVLMMYRDDRISGDDSIYLERCVYMMGQVIHDCENRHNRGYISN